MRRVAQCLVRRHVAGVVAALVPPAPSPAQHLRHTATAPVAAAAATETVKQSAVDFDPKTVDVQRLMLVTTQYLKGSRRSRLAAQRLLDCIQARVDDLPTVFLADVSAGAWPTGIFSDTLRVTIRRRIAKGALDLNGADVARVFVSWSKPVAQRSDVVLFKRLGKLLAYNVNDVRDGHLLCEVLQSVHRAGLKPPPGFLALMARRAVALDRIEPLEVGTAVRLLALLDEFHALDTPTCTALVNRVVARVRGSIEQMLAKRKDSAVASEAETPSEVPETDAASAPSRSADVHCNEIAAAAGLPEDVVAAGHRDNERDVAEASARGTETRDTRWPLTGDPLADVTLSNREVTTILSQHQVSARKLLQVMAHMQEHNLTSPLYSRPIVPLVLPSIQAMHPLEALRWVREGGMKRIVSRRLASSVLAKLAPLDLDFSTQVAIFQAFVSFERHLARKEKRAAEGDETAAETASGAPSTNDKAERDHLNALVSQVLDRLRGIDTHGLQVKPVTDAVTALADLAEMRPAVRDTAVAALPTVVHRYQRFVESGAAKVGQCDDFLEALARLRFDAAEHESSEALAAIKQQRQAVEDRGGNSFDSKVQGSKFVFRELVRANARVEERKGNVEHAVYENVRKCCLARHPMSVLEALSTFEQQFPKALSPSVKREVARALIIALRPGTPTARKETSAKPAKAVPLTVEEFPRFVELARTVGPESLVTAPSFWRFVQERNAMLGNDAGIAQQAKEMLTIFDRRR